MEWDENGLSIVIHLGGRLDLTEDFSVPPLRLAPSGVLARAALEAPTMARLAAFVGWVGNGRPLDEDGELGAAAQEELGAYLGLEPEVWLETDDDFAEAPYCSQVSMLLEWAMVAGFVYQRGQRLFRRRAGRDLDANPLLAWRSAFDALIELGVVDLGGNGPPWGDTVDAAIPDVIVLANTADKPLLLADLVERLCTEEEELAAFGLGEGTTATDLRQAIAEDASVMVQALVDLGVVGLDGQVLRATPLGAWAAVQLLEEDGFEVPLTQ